MDTRGIEVTNQLRSAIRAKLMELGVRYDEELPDYILVMVVNKKSRQQMHDDLNLFLENCTTTFVDWLHDQVLKKLQKVTVARKKSSREFVPAVVVKQEGEKKKRKVMATTFLEEQAVEQTATAVPDKESPELATKAPRNDGQQPSKPSVSNQDAEHGSNRNTEKTMKTVPVQETVVLKRSQQSTSTACRDDDTTTTTMTATATMTTTTTAMTITASSKQMQTENSAESSVTSRTVADSHQRSEMESASSKSLKRSLESTCSSHQDFSADRRDSNSEARKAPRPCDDERTRDDAPAPFSGHPVTSRKLKSYVNKPRITSVVSVKNRLGIVTSPRKKFEIYREKEGNGRYRQSEKRFEKPGHRYDGGRGRNRNFEAAERGGGRRNRDIVDSASRHHEPGKLNDVRSRIESSNRNDRLSKGAAPDSRERTQSSGSKADATAPRKLTCTVKDRLGVVNNKASQKTPLSSATKSQEIADYSRGSLKCSILDQQQVASNSGKTIKDRLGPLRNRVGQRRRQLPRSEHDDDNDDDDDGNEQSPRIPLSLGVGMEGGEGPEEEEEEERDELDKDEQSSGPVKSHIVAVNRSHVAARIERRKRSKMPNDLQTFGIQQQHSSSYSGHVKSQGDRQATSSDVDEEIDDTRLSSKVIVTPRPLKPLQPAQKRATQSLLLRAVAEANHSVVTQKNPEPSLLDKKPVLKRLKPAPARDVSQNLSVHFNSSKRLVMEKIQVELNTVNNPDAGDDQHEPYVPQAIRDEHMGVVMSLFQRSDDNQKFLVTLNGYNNNLMKDKLAAGSEDDEERLEMEVNEDDELALLAQNETAAYAPTAPATAMVMMMTTTSAMTRMENLENGAESETEAADAAEDDTDGSPKGSPCGEENNENCNTENVDKTDAEPPPPPRKRRRLSPIIYNRSHSPSPPRLTLKSNIAIIPASKPASSKLADKKPSAAESTTVSSHLDKSKENCRYWPNCTLGNKCAYFHPPMMCSAFPACKFGEKCAYRHPKCKFGLSCTKPGCVFAHPAQQCKYHPFCTKPACLYSHPVASSIPAAEATSQRAKFTWRRRD